MVLGCALLMSQVIQRVFAQEKNQPSGSWRAEPTAGKMRTEPTAGPRKSEPTALAAGALAAGVLESAHPPQNLIQASAAHGNPVFSASPAETIDCEFRIVWGGGPARSFDATIGVDRGSLQPVRNLSLQDDAVGTIKNSNATTIRVMGHTRSTFGGLDVRVQGTTESQLSIQWNDGPEKNTEKNKEKSIGQQPKRQSVAIKELLAGTWIQPIDNRGSRIAIERQIRDRLRIAFQRQSLIFSPGESFPIEISGNRTGLVGGDYRLLVRLLDQATGDCASQQSIDVLLDAQGSFPNVSPQPFLMPANQGVYEIDVTLQRRRLINSLVNSVAMPSRKLELLVLAAAESAAAPGSWQAIDGINPCESLWWEPLQRLTQTPAVQSITSLASFSAKAIGSQTHQQRSVAGKQALVMAPLAWQAYPLRIAHTGFPHRIKVIVPRDQPMRLAISIQEPNAAGEVSPVSLDSGIVIEDPDDSGADPFVVQDIVFWPKSSRPYILLYNVDQVRPASFIAIEVEQCFGSLPTNHTLLPDGVSGVVGKTDSSSDRRPVALLLDKPLLAENFGANRVVDPGSGRALDAWRTSHEACQRLTEYAKWAGYNSIVLTIAAQGSAIYPSPLLNPTAKFDSGIFLSDGRSPEIKDQVELICRYCDQRGLKVFLALEIEGALTGLESRTATSSEGSIVLQRDLQGRSTLDAQSPNGSRRVRYNPLNRAVQSELEDIVREVALRYGSHDCFAGIVLNLGSQTHWSFAGDLWGYDKESMERFSQALQAKLPSDAKQFEELFRGPLRMTYIQWRAEQMAAVYKKYAAIVRQHQPTAKLVLNTAKILEEPPAEDNFVDVESVRGNPRECLLASGLDTNLVRNEPDIVLLRAEMDSPLQTPVGRSWSMQLASDVALDQQLASDNSGLAIIQAPKGFRLESFEAQSPYGPEKTRTWLFPQVGLPAISARQQIVRRAIENDPCYFAEGGWIGITGGVDATGGLRQALASLPPVKMKDIEVGNIHSAIRVRQTLYQGRFYLQLINAALWTETVELKLRNRSSAVSAQCVNCANSDLSQIPSRSEQVYRVEVRPYDIVAIVMASEMIEVVGVTHRAESGSSETLARKLGGLETLINQVGDPTGQQPLNALGGDFEQWHGDGVPVGWTVSSLPDVVIARDNELPKSGASCLRIQNRSVNGASAWIQSDRITPSPTGRLAIEAWIRCSPELKQPVVRLSLIGRHTDGKRYQRWEDFGGHNQNASLPVDWGRLPIVLLVPDLPHEDLQELKVAIDLIGAGTI